MPRLHRLTGPVPTMVPHGVRNSGDETARCVGFFSAAVVESTFDQPLMPFGQHVVGTPAPEAVGSAGEISAPA